MIRQHLLQWIGMELWRLPEWYSRTEIAKNIGVTKSPTLIKELALFEESGILTSHKFFDDHNRPVIKYKIRDQYREDQLQEWKIRDQYEALDNDRT